MNDTGKWFRMFLKIGFITSLAARPITCVRIKITFMKNNRDKKSVVIKIIYRTTTINQARISNNKKAVEDSV